ncbi:MAG: hypothetical protein MMC23_007498 [Stictis urceolatum]|nr:hypothetical protein [Stictis urceolata]
MQIPLALYLLLPLAPCLASTYTTTAPVYNSTTVELRFKTAQTGFKTITQPGLKAGDIQACKKKCWIDGYKYKHIFGCYKACDYNDEKLAKASPGQLEQVYHGSGEAVA